MPGAGDSAPSRRTTRLGGRHGAAGRRSGSVRCRKTSSRRSSLSGCAGAPSADGICLLLAPRERVRSAAYSCSAKAAADIRQGQRSKPASEYLPALERTPHWPTICLMSCVDDMSVGITARSYASEVRTCRMQISNVSVAPSSVPVTPQSQPVVQSAGQATGQGANPSAASFSPAPASAQFDTQLLTALLGSQTIPQSESPGGGARPLLRRFCRTLRPNLKK